MIVVLFEKRKPLKESVGASEVLLRQGWKWNILIFCLQCNVLSNHAYKHTMPHTIILGQVVLPKP